MYCYPVRKRADDRAALEGILYVIRTGIGWNRLPTALSGASGATCRRRLTEWHEAGVWQQLHERLLAELRAAGLLDLSAAGRLDASACPQRGDHTGPSPVDRRKLGSKHHLITDARGHWWPSQRRHPADPAARRHFKYRRLVRTRGITPLIARRGVEHGSGLGNVRWHVERSFAWLKNLRRLRVRTERRCWR